MEFKLSEARLRELAQIEAEVNCDIEAGFDWGQNLATYLQQVDSYVDDEKLMAVLQERLGGVLSKEELQEMIHGFQVQLRSRVIEKLTFQPPASTVLGSRSPQQSSDKVSGVHPDQPS